MNNMIVNRVITKTTLLIDWYSFAWDYVIWQFDWRRCVFVGANATADDYYNATADYNANADNSSTHCFACVYKDLKAWVTHELLRMCACVGSKQPKYTTWYKGRCQSGLEIKSISECSAAAKALGAPVTSASSDGFRIFRWTPLFYQLISIDTIDPV